MRRFFVALFSSAFILAGFAHADITYHRFWRGARLPSLSPSEFQADLVDVFIPATVRTGAEKGMIGYEPVLTQGVSGLPAGFADEIALVSYQDLDAYNALYSTAEGKAYQALHWHYFDKTRSRSLVPGAYAGTVAVEQAYDLNPSYAGWMTGVTKVRVSLRRSDETDAQFLGRVKAELDQDVAQDPQAGIQDRAILVARDYWIEYVSLISAASAPESAEAQGVQGASDGADFVFSLESEDASHSTIAPGAGINLQF